MRKRDDEDNQPQTMKGMNRSHGNLTHQKRRANGTSARLRKSRLNRDPAEEIVRMLETSSSSLIASPTQIGFRQQVS